MGWKVLGVIVIILLMILSIYLWIDGPCELYKFSSAADIPGRCLIK